MWDWEKQQVKSRNCLITFFYANNVVSPMVAMTTFPSSLICFIVTSINVFTLRWKAGKINTEKSWSTEFNIFSCLENFQMTPEPAESVCYTMIFNTISQEFVSVVPKFHFIGSFFIPMNNNFNTVWWQIMKFHLGISSNSHRIVSIHVYRHKL